VAGYEVRDSMTSFMRPLTGSAAQLLRAALGVASLLLLSSLTACLAPTPAPAKRAAAAVPEVPVPEVPYDRMSAAIELGRPQDALESYEKALAAEPRSTDARILHARLLTLAGKLQEAREELNIVLGQEPRNTDALYNLSVVAELEQRTEERRDLLRQVVEIDAAHADALAGLGELSLHRGDTAAARGFFERALTAEPTHLVGLLGLGAAFEKTGDWKSAEALYARGVAAQPDYPFSFIDRARARQALDDRAGALQDLCQAISLDPDYPWSYIDRGKLYLSLSRGQEAQSDFSVALRLDPGRFETYALRAEARGLVGDAAGALADWEQVVALEPDYWFAWEPMAVAAWAGGAWAKARDAFLRASLAREEEHALVLCAALCAFQAGSPKEAAGIIEPLLSKLPRDSWYHDVARFLVERGTEGALLARIDRERNQALKARMLFYVAVVYHATGMERAGLTYLVQIDGKGAPGAVETGLARAELARRTAGGEQE
jgi:tetratricopeptide (TPR) repeat protein